MSDPEVTSVDPTVLIDRASQSGKPQPAGKPTGLPHEAKASEVVAVDPTALIDRASQSAAPEAIEPTMLVQREQLPRHPASPPARTTSRTHDNEPPAVDPTVLVAPRNRASSTPSRSGETRTRSQPSFWDRFRLLGGGHRAAAAHQTASTGGDRWSPAARGVLLVVAAVVVTALLVVAIIKIGPFSTSGQLLTITKPTHGTIVGSGIECGTDGSDCSTTRSDGEVVKLKGLADDGYVFTGFTGACAQSGRVIMSEARTCGATFEESKSGPTNPVVWALTIEKPVGGTITLAPDITCGTLDSKCSASLQDGSPVKLGALADDGYTFLHFTKACAPDGDTTMTQARTCGATFGPATAPAPVVRPPSSGGGRKASAPPVTIVPTNENAGQGISQPPPPPTSSAGPSSQTTVGPAPPTPPPTKEGPVAPVETAEEHDKKAIQQLVTQYCQEYETLQPARIQKVYPNVQQGALKEQFRQYKSLQCSVAAPPEFMRLDSGEAGLAQVKFGMKQVVQMRSGGAPQTVETIVTMTMTRMSYKSTWLIDRVDYVSKPKP